MQGCELSRRESLAAPLSRRCPAILFVVDLEILFPTKNFGLDSTMVKDDDGIENDDVDVKTCMLETLS